MTRRLATRVVPALLVLGVSGSDLIAPAAAQERERFLYVAGLVGEWVAIGDSAPRALRALDRIALSEKVGVRPGASATTEFRLILRDPRSLRIASWACEPVARCAVTRPVSELTFSGPAIPTSPRTSALFVHLADSPEERARITQVGARGGDDDWGLVLLPLDSATVSLESLFERVRARKAPVVARLCRFTVEPLVPSEDCLAGSDSTGRNCPVDPAVPCVPPASLKAGSVVGLDLYEQISTANRLTLIGTALGITGASGDLDRLTAQLDSTRTDLGLLRPHLSPEEFHALEVAAAFDLAAASGQAR